MTDLVLDRMALDDVRANPQRLAEAIHEQLGPSSGPVRVHEIARALDIVEIREDRLSNLEGALVTTPERGEGLILVNSDSNSQRRRFSIGHELGHFLNSWHRPTSWTGFRCSRSDMIEADLNSRDQYLRQEAEANSFAIELLAPRRRLHPHLQGEADLRVVLAIAAELDISRKAAARRYVSLHGEDLAVVFSRDGHFIYAALAKGFPRLYLTKGMATPSLPEASGGSALSTPEAVAPADWFSRPPRIDLTAQTLHQQNGFATTLLRIVAMDDEDADGLDDAWERLSRFEGGPRDEPPRRRSGNS